MESASLFLKFTAMGPQDLGARAEVAGRFSLWTGLFCEAVFLLPERGRGDIFIIVSLEGEQDVSPVANSSPR